MFRVAGWHTERDGYVKNLTTGNSIQGIENTGGRLRLAFEPSSDLRIDLTAEYLHDGDKAGFGGINQGTGISAEGLAADPRSVFFASPSKLPNLILPRSLRAGYLNADPTLDRNAYSFVGRLEYDAGFATITSVSAYRKLKSIDTRDLDGSSLDTIQQTGDERSKQFTQELRLTSNNDGALSFGGAVDWILGAFYYDDSSDRADIFRLGPDSAVRAAIGTPTTDTVLADYSTKSFAFFGQATLHLTDKFEVTIGGRYSKDKKKVRYIGTTLDSSPLISVGFDSAQKGTFSSFDPRVVATYKFTPDISVYTSYSSGFKSGGFQYAPFNLSATTNVFYPEDIKTYEIGFKTEWLNRALRVNGSLFMYDYKDLQVSRIIDTASGPQTLISNAASSKIKGLELEVLIRPIRNFEASVSYGYLDTKYKDYTFNVDPANPLTFDGTVLVRAPKHSLNVGAEWRIPIGGSELSLRGDYSLLSTFYHEPGEGNPIFGRGISLTKESGYGLLNLAASYEISKIIITGYVKNATNTNYRRSINALGTNVVGFAGEPRIYGVKASYNF
jgi:iron complex outermembrane receptor protein